MKAAETAEIRVETHGMVPREAADQVVAQVGSLLRVAAEPILSAHVMLTVAADPAIARPAVAQATVDMNGRVIRAQAAGQTMRMAIDQMASRLRVRLVRAARNWAALRGTIPVPEPGEWRHQSVPAYRPPYFPRPADQRMVIPRASYAVGPETPDEAVAELNLLDYDFHLFTERSTGQDSVIYRTRGGYCLAIAHPDRGRPAGPLPGSVTLSPLPAPRLTVLLAAGRLEATGEAFTFFIDVATGRGSVLYHRYDGHYGLLVSGGHD